MDTLNISLFENLPIIENGKKCLLIDTGSAETLTGKDTESISKLIGKKISTVLGIDELENYIILFNYAEKKIIFYEETDEFDFDGTEIELDSALPDMDFSSLEHASSQSIMDSFMDTPIITVEIDGSKYRFFLDSATKLSFLTSKVASSFKSTDEVETFYKSFGFFKTKHFRLPTKVGKGISGIKFDVDYGVLPEKAEKIFEMLKVDGVIGFDLFNNLQVLLDIENGTMEFCDNSSQDEPSEDDE